MQSRTILGKRDHVLDELAVVLERRHGIVETRRQGIAVDDHGSAQRLPHQTAEAVEVVVEVGVRHAHPSGDLAQVHALRPTLFLDQLKGGLDEPLTGLTCSSRHDHSSSGCYQ